MEQGSLHAHTSGGPRGPHTRQWPARLRRRAALLAGGAALASLILPAGVSAAAPGRTMPSLASLEARARQLEAEINTLNQQYDGLNIQLSQARSETRIARKAYHKDLTQLGQSRVSVGQLAAQTYMTGGQTSPLALLTSSSAQTLISSAAIMQQLQRENGDRVSQLATAVGAAKRARQTARQQSARAARLVREMAAKKSKAQAEIQTLNSALFARAMAVFQQTGQYPNISIPTANTIGAQALRAALTRRGDPYVWGAAGPNAFDCSGLVMWAYAQVGISLPHYTGSQWNMGIHVSRNQLQPGDLVFFYADIGHVGLYIGNGLMVDAPTFGEPVQVQPVMWNVYVGAVRIVG